MNNAPKVSSSLNGSTKSVLRVRVEVDKPVMQDIINPVLAVKQEGLMLSEELDAASDLIAGASRAEPDRAPPRPLELSLRALRLAAAAEAFAPVRRAEGD